MHLFELEDGDEGTGAGGTGDEGTGDGAVSATAPPTGTGSGEGEAPIPVENPPDATDASSAAPAAADSETWDKQAASLEKMSWWKDVPEVGRPTIIAGVQDVFKGWQRTYNTKLEEVAAQRKTVEADRAQIAELEANWLRMVAGEDDPVKARDEKIAGLESEVAALKSSTNGEAAKSAQEVIAKAKSIWDGERTALAGERDVAKNALSTYVTSVETAYREYLADWLGEHAPDLADDGKELALEMWLDLHTKGRPLDEALKATRAVYPAPEVASPPARPPDAITNMSMGDRAMHQTLAPGDLFERARLATTEIARWPGSR